MPQLSLSLLGPFQATLDGDPVTAFESDKVRALLAYLAVEADRPHRREKLVGLLWPERTERCARQNLSQALCNLRHAIGDRDAQPPFLLITTQTLQFNRSSDHRLDVATLEALLAACKAHPHRRLEACGPCADRLQRAVALYRGAFLEGFSLGGSPAFEEWMLLEQERYHRLVMASLCHLARRCELRGEYEQALEYAWWQAALDPWREEAHRQAMRALALIGRRNEALVQYETCRRVLEEEIGVQPEPETRALYERIRGGLEVLPRVPASSSNLPASLTPFIGREKELAQIEERLEDTSCRLLTLVGPGGIGKTRLALEAAAAQRIQCSHGVFLVPLAPLSSVDGITPAVAEAIGFSFHGKSEPEQQLRDYLHQREMLLVMDNFEHLLSRSGLDEGSSHRDGADWVLDVLKAAPGLTILATSRVRLNIQGEHVFPIDGMGFPAQESTDDFTQYEAIKLFLQTARRARPNFTPTCSELFDVAKICRLVQGMPLGILLAAPWVERFTPAEIAARISRHSLDLLATDLRGIPERQRSIRATFAHSWELLTERERDVLRQLSAFQGGFTQQAAREIAAATPEVLTLLADRSLLQRTLQGRYEMHPLVHQCTAEKLARSPDAGGAVRDRHSAYYATLLEQIGADLKGQRQQAALAEIKAEAENAQAAWSWAASQGQVRRLERALEPLCLFYEWRVRYREGSSACQSAAEKLASAKSRVEPPVRASLLTWQSVFERQLGHAATSDQLIRQSRALLASSEATGRDTRPDEAFIRLQMGRRAVHSDRERARQMYIQSLTLYRALGDRWGMTNALSGLAAVAWNLGDYDEAQELYEESLANHRALGNPRGIANSLSSLGFTVLHQGRLEEAAHLIQESIAIRQETGDIFGLANGLRNLGMTSLAQGKFSAARSLLEKSLAIFGDLGFRYSLETAMVGVAEIHLGRYEQARILAQRGLDISQETGFGRGRGFSLILLGELALVSKDYAAARSSLRESIAVYREIGQREKLIWAYADLGRAALGLGDTRQARRHLRQALQMATQIQAFLSTMLALAATAFLLAERGQRERAVELYALASRYPYVGNSRWFEDVFGRHIAAVAATLPPDVVAAAQARGRRAWDPGATTAELLQEFERW
ncbi:MAG: tetratricopeptide repeat protein [Anaerolineae bacterium]|nr:tetratricopeptide repeat protein [Anaerolineae bacterium]